MKALILAAGFGTRLAPHTQTLPKVLFPIAGEPVLGKMIALLKRSECRFIAVNTHHLADQVQSYLARHDFGLPIHVSHEPEILGTGGAIRSLSHFWEDAPFIVVNADIVTDIDLKAVYQCHLGSDAPVTLVMHDRPPFNQVWVDENDRITGFKRLGNVESGGCRELAFTGIHVIDPKILPWIPREGFSDIIHVYQRMIDSGVPIHAHRVCHHYWQDMGRPDRFRTAVMDAMVPDLFHSIFPENPVASFQCAPLAGDGSDRNWFRLQRGKNSIIVADHGITPTLAGSEMNAFVTIGTHLYDRGIPVPRIYAHDPFSGLVYMEDLGSCHLQQVVHQAMQIRDIEPLYRRVIDTWIDLTKNAAKGFDPNWTCQSRSYDENLIVEKECRYFIDAFVNGFLGMKVDDGQMSAEFTDLARATLDSGTMGLIHRDFQSRNIMVREGRPCLIDFQGARWGPVQYDLASLLIDPYANLPEAVRRRLLDYAVRQATALWGATSDRFIRGFHYCCVTRNLQMLGAFGFLSQVKKKAHFEKWIPLAANMLYDHIVKIDEHRFPRLAAIAKAIAVR